MANKKFWLGMLAIALVFGLALTACPIEDKGDDPPANTEGILTVNNLPEGLAAAVVFKNSSTTEMLATVMAPSSTGKFELYNVSNSSFTQSGNFFVFISSMGAMQDRYKENVAFTKGSATIDWTTMTVWSGGDTSYTVTYNKGGGGGTAPTSQTVDEGTEITLPGQGSMTPPVSGATFAGWLADGIHYSAGETYKVWQNVTFMAQWSGGSGGQTYTVTYNRGTGGGTAPASQIVNGGTEIELPGQGSMTPPSGSGTFTGWLADEILYLAGDKYTVWQNVTFSAQWSGGQQTYTVTYNRGTGGGTAPASQTVNQGENINLPGQGSMTPPGGSGTFTGWSSGGINYAAGASYTVNGNVTFTAQWQTVIPSAQEGLYVGIIKFAGDATDLTDGMPTLLDSAGKSTLTNKLNSEYTISSQSGTALFYGVHRALANLKSTEASYPDNLESVNIVTFTDGLDNASTGRSLLNPIETRTFNTPAEYATYINGEISTRSIAAKPVTAYSVGVRGSDVTDIPGFQSNLANIASTGNSNELTDFSAVQSTFDTIANGLNIAHTNTTFNLVTTLLATGTKVRMTFDSVTTSPTSSARYLEGTISISGSGAGTTFALNNISYGGGLSSSVGTGPITGAINGSEVTFVFGSVTGYNPSADQSNTKQWLMSPGATDWQINSEYTAGGSSSTTIERRSSVIYLVLDCSTSLSTTQIAQIRTAAVNFINSLYNQYNGGSSSTAPNAPTGLTATRQSATGGTISWNPVTGATSYKVYLSSSANGTYSLEGTATTTSYSVFVSSSSVTPYYKVTAVNNNGESAQSLYTQLPAYSTGGGSPTLSSGVWANGNLTQAGQVDQYSFTVTSGTNYYIWWNDSYQGNSTKTGDVKVSAQYSGGSSIFSSTDSGWDAAQSFTASTSGTVIVSVQGYDSSYIGTYGIVYTANSNARPTP